MDINYLDFKFDIFGSHTNRLKLIAEKVEKYLNMKLMDLYNEDTIIENSIGCKNDYQEHPIYSVLRIHDCIFNKTYSFYFILKTTMENINQNIYQIIEAKIREEARNNIYSEDNKEALKLFVKNYGKRTKEEIADIFNEKENIINQPDNITPKVIEEKPIIKPYENLHCGLIEPWEEVELQNRNRVRSSSAYLVHNYDYDEMIKKMYFSSAIDGTQGEVSKEKIFYENFNMINFDLIKDNLLIDFINYAYYSEYTYKDSNDIKYILFSIYKTILNIKDYPCFIRYIAPIRINENSNETVLEAVLEYFNYISGRVSNEYQRRIDAFQKKYNR